MGILGDNVFCSIFFVFVIFNFIPFNVVLPYFLSVNNTEAETFLIDHFEVKLASKNLNIQDSIDKQVVVGDIFCHGKRLSNDKHDSFNHSKNLIEAVLEGRLEYDILKNNYWTFFGCLRHRLALKFFILQKFMDVPNFDEQSDKDLFIEYQIYNRILSFIKKAGVGNKNHTKNDEHRISKREAQNIVSRDINKHLKNIIMAETSITQFSKDYIQMYIHHQKQTNIYNINSIEDIEKNEHFINFGKILLTIFDFDEDLFNLWMSFYVVLDEDPKHIYLNNCFDFFTIPNLNYYIKNSFFRYKKDQGFIISTLCDFQLSLTNIIFEFHTKEVKYLYSMWIDLSIWIKDIFFSYTSFITTFIHNASVNNIVLYDIKQFISLLTELVNLGNSFNFNKTQIDLEIEIKQLICNSSKSITKRFNEVEVAIANKIYDIIKKIDFQNHELCINNIPSTLYEVNITLYINIMIIIFVCSDIGIVKKIFTLLVTFFLMKNKFFMS